MAHLSEPAYAVSFASLAVLCALWLRKLVRMDGHHKLRVAVITMLLWAVVLLLFMLVFPPWRMQDYVPLEDDVSDSFTISG